MFAINIIFCSYSCSFSLNYALLFFLHSSAHSSRVNLQECSELPFSRKSVVALENKNTLLIHVLKYTCCECEINIYSKIFYCDIFINKFFFCNAS